MSCDAAAIRTWFDGPQANADPGRHALIIPPSCPSASVSVSSLLSQAHTHSVPCASTLSTESSGGHLCIGQLCEITTYPGFLAFRHWQWRCQQSMEFGDCKTNQPGALALRPSCSQAPGCPAQPFMVTTHTMTLWLCLLWILI